MSERMEEMLAKLIQLQEETIKEIKINNRLLAFINYYGTRPAMLAEKDECDFIERMRDREI